jgi:hypothetical protein
VGARGAWSAVGLTAPLASPDLADPAGERGEAATSRRCTLS